MKTNFQKVRDFHEKFGIPVNKRPYLDDNQEVLLRLRLIAEEYSELVKALNLKDMTGVADALGDLLYVVYGSAVSFGIPVDDVFDIVHNANMTKRKGTDSGGKLRKPDDFTGPEAEISKLLGEICAG